MAERTRAADAGGTERELLAVLDRGWRETQRRAGSWLVCEPGCDRCCHGLFPISRLDIVRLRRGLRTLEADRARAVRQRAAAAVARLSEGFPGDARSGSLTADEAQLDRFFEAQAGLACPALDPESGTCTLYAHRPVACRTFGPPLRFGDRRADPCGLCFQGAPATSIEASRWEPDAEGLERALLAEAGAGPDEHWATLIPWALRPEPIEEQMEIPEHRAPRTLPETENA